MAGQAADKSEKNKKKKGKSKGGNKTVTDEVKDKKGKNNTSQRSTRTKKKKKDNNEGTTEQSIRGARKKATTKTKDMQSKEQRTEQSTTKTEVDGEQEQTSDTLNNTKNRNYTRNGVNRNPLTVEESGVKLSDTQMAALRRFVDKVNKQTPEGLLAEFETVKQWNVWTDGNNLQDLTKIHNQNPTKNRYKDIFCLDSSRVPITDGKGCEYINANWVRGEPFINDFICTQGPLADTVVDFWRMVVEQKVGYIIMLCELIEMGKNKCEKYFPNFQETMNIGDMKISCPFIDPGDVQFLFSTMIIELPTGAKKVVFHWQWKDWPDRGTPITSNAALRALRLGRASKFATLIHCSAGVGRTGTLISAEYCIQQIMQGKDVDMVQMVKDLRKQRAHVVQTGMQYCYVALVVQRWLCALTHPFGSPMNNLTPDDIEYRKYSDAMNSVGKTIPRAQGGTGGPQVAVAGAVETAPSTVPLSTGGTAASPPPPLPPQPPTQ